MMRLEERGKLLEAINRDLNRTNRQIADFRPARILTIIDNLAPKQLSK